jgi:hypothetical protein
MEIKHAKKRLKGAGADHWLALVTRYNFLFAGVVCHCVLLLLLAMVLTLHDATAHRYQTLLDLLAVFLVVVLVLVWQLRWTYPLSNELPLLILLLWIVLSSRISPTHCFCCHEHHHHADTETAVTGALAAAADGNLTTGEDAAAAAVAVVTAAHHHTPPPSDPDDDFLMESWRWAMADCRAEHFNFFFSLLCLVMVLCAFLTELRSSLGSLLFRLSTAVLVAVVAVLFFVSPSLCSRFSIELGDSFVTVARITLFEALWALNRYARGCERLLSRAYQHSVLITHRHLLLEARAPSADKEHTGSLPAYITDYQFATPRGHNVHMTKLYKYLAQRYPSTTRRRRQQTHDRRETRTARETSQKRARSGHSLLLPMGRSGGAGFEQPRHKSRRHRYNDDDEDDDDYYTAPLADMDEEGYSDEEYEEEEEDGDDGDESDDGDGERATSERPRLQAALPPPQPLSQADAAAAEEKKRARYVLVQVWQSLWQLSHSYRQRYVGGFLSWKNRGYSKHLLHLIDLAICLWVLLVCPPWLWLAPLEIVWLLYYVYICKQELAGAQAQAAVLARVVARDDALAFGVAVLTA